jgi:hypothetical protein
MAQEKELNEQEEKGVEEEKETEEMPHVELPPVNFENFILGLRSTAFMHMGFRDPESGELFQNLQLARHTIDTMGMIQEKTKGNLTAPESNLLENILYELRMSYVRAAKESENQQKAESKEEAQKDSESHEEPKEQDDS